MADSASRSRKVKPRSQINDISDVCNENLIKFHRLNVVEFKNKLGNARLMRKNVEIVLIHSLLNVCD